jgi:hypothetical protein
LVVCVLLALAVFLAGGAAAWKGYLDISVYALLTGILGSVASVVGLISLASKRLTSSDIREVETDLLADLANTSRQLKEYEEKLAKNVEEVSRIELRRAEIEVLVRKAGAKIFMEEQLRRTVEEIENCVLEYPKLHDMLQSYGRYKDNIAQLDGEIVKSPNAELIISIAEEVMSRGRRYYIHLMGAKIEVSPLVGALDMVAKIIAKAAIR